MSSFSVVSLDDVRTALTQLLNSARGDGPKIGLNLLLQEVDLLQKDKDGSHVIDDGPWWLTKVSATGFRGIGEQLSIEFPPTPGVTVIHGPNGSGKSSIADALDVALHRDAAGTAGRPQGTHSNQPLWAPILRSRHSVETTIDVELRNDQASALHLSVSLDENGIVTRSEATFAKASCPKAHIDLGDSWNTAVRAFRPVYTYGAWADKLVTARDLNQYVFDMLAIGRSMVVLRDSIKSRAEGASDARKRLQAAWQTASRACEEIDVRYSIEKSPLPPLDLATDIDSWTASANLGNSSEVSGDSPLEKDLWEQLHRASSSFQSHHGAVQRATLPPSVYAALTGLQGCTQEIDPSTCPVCETQNVPWAERLDSRLASAKEAGEVFDTFRKHATHLIETASKLEVFAGVKSFPILAQAADATAATRESLQANGAAHPQSLSALRELTVLLDDESFTAELSTAIQTASHEAQWRAARRTATLPFVNSFNENVELARSVESWEQAKRQLDKAEELLRERRAGELSEETSRAAAELLSDVGVVDTSFQLTKLSATMQLRDERGELLELGRLSAGQRNAVILAPAVHAVKPGPFRFFVLDDPVHALDEIRIDKIARLLRGISTSHRVIVLTHDERLKEHLTAGAESAEVIGISRDHGTGAVEMQIDGPIWRTLVLDAKAILTDLAKSDPLRLGVTPTVRTLCRQAVDNAVRHLVLREAVTNGIGSQEWLDHLDNDSDAWTTKQRIEKALALPLSETGIKDLTGLRDDVDPFLADWNSASHGNRPTSPVTMSEVDAAARACERAL